jgi:hypothetical protein
VKPSGGVTAVADGAAGPLAGVELLLPDEHATTAPPTKPRASKLTKIFFMDYSLKIY